MHYSVLTILPGIDYVPLEIVQKAIDVLMDPYNENEHRTDTWWEDGESYHSNPEGRWDWFVIGGRWANELRVGAGGEGWKVIPDALDRSRLHYSNWFAPVGPDGGEASIARKRDVDLEAMGMAQVELVTSAWNQAQEDLAAGDPGMTVRCTTGIHPGESLDEALLRLVRPFTTYAFVDGDGWDARSEWYSDLSISEMTKVSDEERAARVASEEKVWEAHCIDRWRQIPDDAWVAIVDIHS